MALTSNVSNGMNFALSDHGSARFCAPDGVDQVIELHDRNDHNFDQCDRFSPIIE